MWKAKYEVVGFENHKNSIEKEKDALNNEFLQQQQYANGNFRKQFVQFAKSKSELITNFFSNKVG
jgi:hypothetical protein